jgi:arylsulfatase A-like enzyme
MNNESRRPNILMFMPDQLRADAVGAFGSKRAVTPNIDALAANGTIFRNAYAQHPVCSPSRCSFMTGWYPHVRGHRTLTHLLKPDEPNLLKILKDSGYHVAWAGKRGDTFAPGVVEDSTHFYAFDQRPEMMFEFSNEPRDDIDARTFYHGRRRTQKDDTPCFDFDEAATCTAERLLLEGMPEPWILLVALIFPHPPFEVEAPWFDLHQPDLMEDPVHRVSGPEPRYMSALRKAYRSDRATLEHWRQIRSVYYGMVSRVDAQLGRLMHALDESRQRDRTATIFFTDHGEYLGDYGLVEKWPAGLENCLVQNPLIISPPGGGVGEAKETKAMVELVDLLPTCLDWAGVAPSHTHFGKSLLPLLENPTAAHKPYAISEAGFALDEQHLLEKSKFPYDLKAAVQAEDITNVGRGSAIRTPDWSYVHRPYDTCELYDRHDDPGETRNLIDDPSRSGVIQDHRDLLLDFMTRTSDVIPWDADPRF